MAPLTAEQARAIVHDGETKHKDYADAFEIVYGYRPMPEEVPVKKPETTKLNIDALYNIIAAMESAREKSIGTFHLPDFDNIKVKFDKESGEHYIKALLL